MKTFRIRREDIRRRWHLIDAAGQTLGKVAVRAAHLLMGKDSPTFTPGTDCGDFVVVTNAEKVRASGHKLDKKMYRHHTLYLGGLVEEPMSSLLNRKPQRVIQMAVRRMLPKNTVGKHSFGRLKVYAGKDHPHAAQNPVAIAVSRRPAQPAAARS